MHTCATTGKSYVGFSKFGMAKRWEQHKKNSKTITTSYFHNAILKYGPENFVSEILYQCDTSLEASIVEKYFIRFYDTTNSGYNITDGGYGMCGFSHSEKTKKKISKANKGENNSMYGKYGENNPNFGRKNTPETIERMREVHLNRNEEWNEKISASLIGYEKTKEHKEAISAAFKNKPIITCSLCGQKVKDIGKNFIRHKGSKKCKLKQTLSKNIV